MRQLNCFVIMPSGSNPPMRLVADERRGLCEAPSSCKVDHEPKNTIEVRFQDVYEFIIKDAVEKVNADSRDAGIRIECFRGEDLPEGGNIVSQFLKRICQAEITITDATGLNPNVMLEYGIRLSVRDSLNILLCHKGVELPIDIADQRCIWYSLQPAGVNQARAAIVQAIQHGLEALQQKSLEPEANLFRRTVETATGRDVERKLTPTFERTPALVADLIEELHRLDTEGKVRGDPKLRAEPQLRYRAWTFLAGVGAVWEKDPTGPDRAIELYEMLTRLNGFKEKYKDIFYKLNEICALDPDRSAKAEAYLQKARELEQ
jgi:hypothetical protein